MKDVTPELRLAEIENTISTPKNNYSHYAWIITLGAIGTLITVYHYNRQQKKKETEKK